MNQPPLPQNPNCQSNPKPPEPPCPEQCPKPEEPPKEPCPDTQCPTSEEPPDKPCPDPKPEDPPKEPCPAPQCPDPVEPPPPPPCEPPEPTPCPPSETPAQQLDALRKLLDAGQREMLKFEPLKTSLEDLVERIKALETSLAELPDATAAYTEFFRAVERYRSEIECGIPTVRCQLDLSDKQVACVEKAIEAVDGRVKKALADSQAQDAEVKARRAKQVGLDAELEWTKRWFDFFRTGLQGQITRQREDLKALSLLADPSKDQCEVWFYLSEMEDIVRSARTDENSTACYDEAINIATFLDCWPPKCYTTAYQHWMVAFNNAESAQKIGAIELDQAEKHAAALAALAQGALAKRREWILKEIKTQDCCGSTGKCP